jgi:hypothetical protein
MSTHPQSGFLSLRICEAQEAEESPLTDSFAAALLDVADEYTPDPTNAPRTLGRTIPLKKEESNPAARKKEEKLAAALRKLEEKEAAKRMEEERAAAKRMEEEERAAAKRREKENAAERKREEKARRSGSLSRAFSWLKSNRAFGSEKQMRVLETVSLGEKRFVSILQVDGRKFLIGGSASSVSLLTGLEPTQSSSDVIKLMPAAGERLK